MSKRSPFIVHTSRMPCREATQKMGEALGSYGCVRRKVAPPCVRTGHCGPAAAVRQPGYLPSR
jgi:hypothetical protein